MTERKSSSPPKVFCGIFEKLHYLMGMEDAMINFYEEPEAMHELIDYLADWEITLAEETIKYVHPDCLFHHDDWGSQTSLFISKEMFDEFLLPAYKKIYGYWKANGVEVIVHHSDSYAADLVPEMIEMGVDVFQGAVSTTTSRRSSRNTAERSPSWADWTTANTIVRTGPGKRYAQA